MMLLRDVVAASQRVTGTTRRLEKIDLLAALLQQLAGDEIEIVVAFLSGSTRQGRIGIGYATLREAAAPEAPEETLQIRDVDQTLESLTTVRGRGSEQQKRALLHSLFARATAAEQGFLKALLTGEIRQGALEGVMLEALAKASGVSPEILRRAVMMAGDMGRVARSVFEFGAAGLDQYTVQLFRPVQPMLAQTAEDVGAALGELGEAALEFKFDGARVQVHRAADEVQVYTRALNNVTIAVPEIVEAVRGAPAEFADYHAGEKTRTPAQILAHIGDLLDWSLSIAKGKEEWHNAAPLPWDQEVGRFFAALERFDAYLASDAPLESPAERLFQGPIADALAHAGQIAMLRRMAGSPVRGENYHRAEIAIGRVGADQVPPRREFD